MTAKYNVISKSNPRNPNAPKRYYPSIKTTNRTTLRQLSEEIADISTVSPPDIIAVLESLLMLIPQKLEDGHVVELGDFGSFLLRIRSEGADTPEGVTARSIKQVLVRFNPGQRFKQALRRIAFEKHPG